MEYAATPWNTLKHTTIHCNTLQHTVGLPVIIWNVGLVWRCAPNPFSVCKTLQDTTRHCRTVQHSATQCNTMQHNATQCNTVQHIAIHYNTLQPAVMTRSTHSMGATRCNTLQHTATHCNTHQATHYDTPQHTTTVTWRWPGLGVGQIGGLPTHRHSRTTIPFATKCDLTLARARSWAYGRFANSSTLPHDHTSWHGWSSSCTPRKLGPIWARDSVSSSFIS